MKTCLKFIVTLISALVLTACAEDIVDLTGSVNGTVKDYDEEGFLENCRVSVSPGGLSTVTDAKGYFAFEGLEPGTYSLSFTKPGYSDQAQDVTIITGQTSRVFVFLKKEIPPVGSISGIVTDYEDESFLENCRISLSPGGMSTVSDAKGAFGFEGLEPGTYSLSISKPGYTDQVHDVSVTKGQISRVYVFLKKEIPPIGSISGIITDYNNSHPISNCSVSLSPGGISKTSSTSGTYNFSDLDPGEYTLVFSKAGYESATKTVEVTAGKNATADILLKAKSPFALSEDSYDFGDLEVSKTFYFLNNSDEGTSFELSNIPSWLSFSQTSGALSALGSLAVTATVDRSKVEAGEYIQNIMVAYSGKVSGVETITVKMKKVVLSAPSVTIVGNAENIKQNGFDIRGSITATGGSQITNYGHCWNTTGNPAIDDNKTDLGTTSAICTYMSTAMNLDPYTTYYVRAYAKNAQGVAYSDEIAVTTQDLTVDRWDGNIASSFSGGSGTAIDPYVIMTGGQLLLAKNYSNKYFVLGGNIDLNNKNWLPYEFKGNLDGKNYTVSNLYVDRIEPYQGLFSKCSGFVSNLTVRNVYINAGTLDYIGAISGSGGTITNCKVVLGNSSLLVGDYYVGGISGHNAQLTDCSVESDAASAVIKGNRYVGGLIGYVNRTADITNSHVSCKLMGTNYVGGIIGSQGEYRITIQNCSFTGDVTGEDYVGGICGGATYGLYAKGCKVQANLVASNGSAGGILATSGNSEIYGCYAAGTLSASGNASGIAYWSSVYLSYSVMTSSSPSYYGIGHNAEGQDCATTASKASYYGANCKANCTDITTFLRECYSEHADYWDFNNTWVWTGTVDGKTVEVSCPRLAWE